MIDIRTKLYEGSDDDIIEALALISGDGYTHSDCIKRLLRELIVTRNVMVMMAAAPMNGPAIMPAETYQSDDPLDIDWTDIDVNL